MAYAAVGFDLLTALLDTWSLWSDVAGDRALGMRWHGASQALLRGRRYRPFEEIIRESASEVGVDAKRASTLLRRWGEFEPWPDVPPVLDRLDRTRRFVVTNCSRKLGRLAALERLGLDPAEVLFVAGSAHDVGGAARAGMDVYWANRGGAPAPTDGAAVREEPDFRGLLETMGISV